MKRTMSVTKVLIFPEKYKFWVSATGSGGFAQKILALIDLRVSMEFPICLIQLPHLCWVSIISSLNYSWLRNQLKFVRL